MGKNIWEVSKRGIEVKFRINIMLLFVLGLWLATASIAAGHLWKQEQPNQDVISYIQSVERRVATIENNLLNASSRFDNAIQKAKDEIIQDIRDQKKDSNGETGTGCQEIGINYNGNDLGCVKNINTWQECSAYCRTLPKCRYWTWISDRLPGRGKDCCPKSSDAWKIRDDRVISGTMDCGQTGLTLQELKFEGGRPSASSTYDTSSNFIPSHAFQEAPTRFWQSGRDEKGLGELAVPFPHAIWYEFPKPVIPGKVSFRPSPREGGPGDGFIGATKYQFVGSNDWPCSRYSRWTVLCEDLSGKLFERRTQSKYCTVDLHGRREAFRCLGINVLGSGYDKYVTVELTGIRMWKMA